MYPPTPLPAAIRAFSEWYLTSLFTACVAFLLVPYVVWGIWAARRRSLNRQLVELAYVAPVINACIAVVYSKLRL
ncbi:hypothetical protein D0B32_28055 [Paraburkholderia sp. DHOC27]|nr:hypothetical protein D0B32_28055 [Paraburkholderia sp. DHOC27]